MGKQPKLQELSVFLTDHIKDIEREKDLLLKEYYSDNVEESMYVVEFFREYTNTINEYLSTVKENSGSNDSCPFVIIKSIVEVQDTDDMESYQYYIVPPYWKSTDMGIDSASCLSPLGKALLFKKVNQKVNIQIPTGTLHYVIKKITIPDQIISEYSDTTKIKNNTYTNEIGLSL
ncbi:MAG: GreA/GreB family elongation factor [Acetivibrionales bacterium]